MLTRLKRDQIYFRELGRAALKQFLLGQLVLFLSIAWSDPLQVSPGDQALAQSASNSVFDRIPESTAAVISDRGDNLFLVQILYAGAIVWIISLMGSSKN